MGCIHPPSPPGQDTPPHALTLPQKTGERMSVLSLDDKVRGSGPVTEPHQEEVVVLKSPKLVVRTPGQVTLEKSHTQPQIPVCEMKTWTTSHKV